LSGPGSMSFVNATSQGRMVGRLNSSAAQIWLPVLVVGLVVAGLVAIRLEVYGGNLTGFIEFGRTFASYTHPPHGSLITSASGYDGQFFFLQARDPLLLHHATVAGMRAAKAGFRLQRMAYPALAFLLAGGRVAGLPYSLLAINVLVLLALAGCFAAYAHRRGWSTLWAVALALMPGFLLPALRDLSDPLASASVLAGVLLAQSGRRWSAAAALAVAVLTREAMMAVVVALALELGVRAWRARQSPGGWRAVARARWPGIVIPGAAYVLWQTYVMARYGGPVGEAHASIPFLNLVQEIRWSLAHAPIPAYAGWDVIYVGLILAATLTAWGSLCRGVTLPGLAACAVSLGVVLPVFGDAWSDTRLSAPLFALLLVDALQRRRRWTARLSGAAAAMTLLIPLALPGVL
jgi:hypothetical protein